MKLWQLLALGVVRLGLAADWVRMEIMVNHYLLMRQMLQLTPDPWALEAQQFNHQTLRDAAAQLDEELLRPKDGKTCERIESTRHAGAASQGAPVQTAA